MDSWLPGVGEHVAGLDNEVAAFRADHELHFVRARIAALTRQVRARFERNCGQIILVAMSYPLLNDQ
jgi:hypothetical protein